MRQSSRNGTSAVKTCTGAKLMHSFRLNQSAGISGLALCCDSQDRVCSMFSRGCRVSSTDQASVNSTAKPANPNKWADWRPAAVDSPNPLIQCDRTDELSENSFRQFADLSEGRKRHVNNI